MGLKRLEIIWSEPAERSLDNLLGYIAVANLDAAKTLLDRTLAAVEQLAVYPEPGRPLPELGRPYRELVSVRPFRIIYRIEKRDVLVIGVMRAEQLFDPGRFLEP